ncbi:hypothetical protein ACTXT7_014502 [Hymenolepis weldensis]
MAKWSNVLKAMGIEARAEVWMINHTDLLESRLSERKVIRHSSWVEVRNSNSAKTFLRQALPVWLAIPLIG